VGANVGLGRKVGITEFPVHFSPTVALPFIQTTVQNMPIINDAWKSAYLVKYSFNGKNQYREM